MPGALCALTTLQSVETLIEDSHAIMAQENLVPLRALPQYGYIYNLATTVPQTINSGQPIPFSSSSTFPATATATSTNQLTTAGIKHTAGSPQITIVNTGVYFVSFVVYAIQANQFALFLQAGSTAIPAPICNTNYGVGTAYSPTSGFAVINVTVANSILTLVNYVPFVNQVNTQGTNVGITNIGQTTLAYFDTSTGATGLTCGGLINPSVNNTFSSFTGGLEINTVNAALFIQQLA